MYRYIKYILSIAVFGLRISSAFAYQQQGFTSYQEGYGNKIDFTCESQCIVVMEQRGGLDYLYLQGQLEGNGTIGYGFLVGDQVAPGEMLQINGITNVDQKLVFANNPYISQISKEAQIALIMQGNIKGGQVLAQGRYYTFGQKISQGRKDFWKIEPMTPYSINLRYGVKINGNSLVKIGYIIAILALIWIFVFSKKSKERKFKLALYRVLGIFLFIGLRNLVSYWNIVEDGVTNYTNQPSNQKSFWDLGDYITFTDKVRTALDLDNGKKDCVIYAEAIQDRPFRSHRETLYLLPCTLTKTGTEADYAVFYKVQPRTGYEGKNTLVNFNGSYLFGNK